MEQAGYLIIADISGYTQFIKIHNMRKAPIFGEKMAQKWESHAEHIITELLETVIEAFEGNLILNKLEGDAAFFFAVEDGSAQQADRILECMDAAMSAFSQKLVDIVFIQSCPCDPCQQSKNLRLKIFAHKGSYQIKKIRQFEELAGESVILIHRLMKNALPSREYWLVTESFFATVSDPEKFQFGTIRQKVDDFGTVDLKYIDFAFDGTDSQSGAQKPAMFGLIKMLAYFKSGKVRTSLTDHHSE
jgi:hypothetical protein